MKSKTPLLVALFAGGAALFIAGSKKSKATVSKKENGKEVTEDVLDGIYEQDAPISEEIINKLSPNITQFEVDKIRNTVVTNLTPKASSLTFDEAINIIDNKSYNLDIPEERDEAIKVILETVAPKADWSQKLSPYTFGSKFQKVWFGVDDVIGIAELHNKYEQ